MKLKHDKNYNVYVGEGDDSKLIAPGEVVEFEDSAFAQSQFDLNPEILIRTEDEADRVFGKDGEEKEKKEDKPTKSEVKPEPKPEPEPKTEPKVEEKVEEVKEQKKGK